MNKNRIKLVIQKSKYFTFIPKNKKKDDFFLKKNYNKFFIDYWIARNSFFRAFHICKIMKILLEMLLIVTHVLKEKI